MSARAPEADEAPRVGVGVLLLRATQVLLGRRRGAHGAGTWAAPGGHLAFGETAEDCARREVFEETGLTLAELRAGPYVGNLFESVGRHYVTLFMLASPAGGEPRTMEPDKCDGWSWFDWHDLPSPLFPPLASLREQGWLPPAAEGAPPDGPLLDHLQALERELHHPGGPGCRPRLDHLLHPDFHEVGKSGLAYGRAQVLAHLAVQAGPADCVSDGYRLERLAADCMLLTYRSTHAAPHGGDRAHVLRSSVWCRTEAGWRLRYHQGTLAPGP